MSDVKLDEIKRMQDYLGIKQRAASVYRSLNDRDSPSYQEWLPYYYQELKSKCEQKLVQEYLQYLGSDLFKGKFNF